MKCGPKVKMFEIPKHSFRFASTGLGLRYFTFYRKIIVAGSLNGRLNLIETTLGLYSHVEKQLFTLAVYKDKLATKLCAYLLTGAVMPCPCDPSPTPSCHPAC